MKTRNNKLVSVIMPVYNEEKYLCDAIQSVLTQDYVNLELILIDDCSTDQSRKIIEEFDMMDERVVVFGNEVHKGVSATRNLGIQNSRGDYIAFLDADDIWLEKKLSTQIAFMENNQIHFCCTSYRNLKKGKTSIIPVIPQKILSFRKLLFGNFVGCLTVIYSVEKFGRRLFKDTGHPDYLLWLEMLKQKGVKAASIQKPLALYRIGHKSLSSDKKRAVVWQWCIYRSELKFHLTAALLFMIPYAFFGVYKKLI